MSRIPGEGHPARPHGTGGQWRNELGDAVAGAGHPHIDRRSLEMARLGTVPHLFHNNAVVMFANREKARIGSITSRWEHFHE